MAIKRTLLELLFKELDKRNKYLNKVVQTLSPKIRLIEKQNEILFTFKKQ